MGGGAARGRQEETPRADAPLGADWVKAGIWGAESGGCLASRWMAHRTFLPEGLSWAHSEDGRFLGGPGLREVSGDPKPGEGWGRGSKAMSLSKDTIPLMHKTWP